MRELGSVPGVETVEADQRTQIVRVTFDAERLSPDEVRDELGRAGFPAE